MTGPEMLFMAVEESKGKAEARRIAETFSPLALASCTLDLVLIIKLMEKKGLIPAGLLERAQRNAEDKLKKEGHL